jgi:hypothetical protein
MYLEQCLVRERHQELLRQAEDASASHQVIERRRLARRQERAERQLLRAWQRVEYLWSIRSVG